MNSRRKYNWVAIAAGFIFGHLYFIAANIVLLLRGHGKYVPYTGEGSTFGYTFVFCVYVGIFSYPLRYLHTTVTTKSKSSTMALIISLPLVLFGALYVTYFAFDADVLMFIEGRSGGGGAAFGFILVFFYLLIALPLGAAIGKLTNRIYRN